MKAASDSSVNPRRVAAMALLFTGGIEHHGKECDLRPLIQAILKHGAIRVGEKRWVGLGIYGIPVTFMRGGVWGVTQGDIALSLLRVRHIEAL